MDSETWLNPAEITELTGIKKSWKAQCRKLAEMGIPFRPNGIGRPLVQREIVLIRPQISKIPKKPNWNALDGKAAQN